MLELLKNTKTIFKVCRTGAKLCHADQEEGKEVDTVLSICAEIQIQIRKGVLVATV